MKKISKFCFVLEFKIQNFAKTPVNFLLNCKMLFIKNHTKIKDNINT